MIGSGRCCWKGWKRRQLEGLDDDQKGCNWKCRRLNGLEADVGFGCCCWKGWKRRQLEGLETTSDPDVDQKELLLGGLEALLLRRSFRLALLLLRRSFCPTLLLIVPIDTVVVVV